jgi:tetratricopeptide (TPR) repeat protein
MKMTKKAITLSLGLVVMGSASFAQSLNDAKKALDAEQYQKATSMLKSLVSSQGGKGENYFNLGEVYLQTDYIDSARAVFTKGITADPKNPLNYIGLGEADLLSNNAASAKTNFAKAVEASSKKDYIPQLYIGKAYLSGDKPDFAAALPFLQKADELDKDDKDAETFLALGDYNAYQKKNSEALQSYLRALNINPNILRAKVQIGRMYKESRAFPEAETTLKEVIAQDANYGPAYRELSELYNQWSFGAPDAEAKSALAIENYKKYLDLTDKSFDSRIRFAQILFYARDFKQLEAETSALAAMNPNSPKSLLISRLRGYSAFENKNYPQALEYMNDFFAKVKDTSRIVADDYLYLGQAQLQNKQDSLAVKNIMKAVSMDSTKVEALADVAKSYYDQKMWPKAIETYTLVNKLNPNGKGSLYNNFYQGISLYFEYAAGLTAKTNPSKDLLVRADTSFKHVAKVAPTTTDAYLWSGRALNLLEDEKNPQGAMLVPYQTYIDSTEVSKTPPTPASQRNLVEAYNVVAGFASFKADKEKAKLYWDKALAIDPANATALAGVKSLTAPAPRTAGKKK